MNAVAAAATAIGTLLAAVSHAVHPGQVAVSPAAGCAFLAAFSRGRQVAPSDWSTVRVLLAGNLVVFGISNAHLLGVALAVPVVLSGVTLLVVAICAYMLQPGKRRAKR